MIGDGADVLAGDPDFDAGLRVDGLHFRARTGAEQPFVRAGVFDSRIEAEWLPTNAVEGRRHERRGHFPSVTLAQRKMASGGGFGGKNWGDGGRFGPAYKE